MPAHLPSSGVTLSWALTQGSALPRIYSQPYSTPETALSAQNPISSAVPWLVDGGTSASDLQISAVLPGIMIIFAKVDSNLASAMVQLLKTATPYSDLGVQNVCGPSALSKSSDAAGSCSSKSLLRWRLIHACYAASMSYFDVPVLTAPPCMSVQRSGVA